LLETMIRQYEAAKLDEAKEGPALQRVDIAQVPDRKSKPSVTVIVLVAAALALLLSTGWVVMRRYTVWSREQFPEDAEARAALWRAWRWRT
jgi:tyrosine-protein kinase Etk/Wzc